MKKTDDNRKRAIQSAISKVKKIKDAKKAIEKTEINADELGAIADEFDDRLSQKGMTRRDWLREKDMPIHFESTISHVLSGKRTSHPLLEDIINFINN